MDLLIMEGIINAAQKRHNKLLSDAIGNYLDDIATSIEKQKKLDELFDSHDKIDETLWIFQLIKDELRSNNVDKSSCLVKILFKNLNSSHKFWIKIFKITNSECSCSYFGDLLNIRIVRQTTFNIVIMYFKSLAYDGHYFISEDLIEDKSKVKFLKSIDFSQMIGFLYFLMNYKDDISLLISKCMTEFDPAFVRYLFKSFKVLSL
ncbi:unnamed protein product [Chironomus riparius]|uniref:Uncharacterized protein n=1 Tax=Chironomus riparius TaxID=315576 RepID=A0A9P0J5A1_9DIPT|nr:unnamed protein product [Chironomus riparius]